MSQKTKLQFEGRPVELWMLQSSPEGLKIAYNKGIDTYLNITSDWASLEEFYDPDNPGKLETKQLEFINSRIKVSRENRMIEYVMNQKRNGYLSQD